MLVVSSDIKRTKRKLRYWQRDQVPFAASVALNNTAFDTKKFVAGPLWKNAFPRAKKAQFPQAMFRVDKASKRRLRAVLGDLSNRSQIIDHNIEGGIRTPQRSSAILAPGRFVESKRTAGGKISKRFSPATVKGAFVAPTKTGEGIWQRTGRGGKTLRFLYSINPSTSQPVKFPFYKAGIRYAGTRWGRNFERAIDLALNSARGR